MPEGAETKTVVGHGMGRGQPRATSRHYSGPMFVPFSVSDFPSTGPVQVYGDRIGVVDEPDQPAPSPGRA